MEVAEAEAVEAIEATLGNVTETNEKAVIQVLVEVPEDLAEAIGVDLTEAAAEAKVAAGAAAEAAGVECALNAEAAIEDLAIFMTAVTVTKIASMGIPMTSPLLVLLRPQLRPTPLRLHPPPRCRWPTPMATKATMNLVESIIGITPP